MTLRRASEVRAAKVALPSPPPLRDSRHSSGRLPTSRYLGLSLGRPAASSVVAVVTSRPRTNGDGVCGGLEPLVLREHFARRVDLVRRAEASAVRGVYVSVSAEISGGLGRAQRFVPQVCLHLVAEARQQAVSDG